MARAAQTVLEVNLAFDAGGEGIGNDGTRAVGLHAIVSAAKSPRSLYTLLAGARCDTVLVRKDGLPQSGVQAMALVIVGLMPARRWTVVDRSCDYDRDRERVATGRLAFLARALWRLPVAVALELAHTARLRRVVLDVARRDHRLPRTAATRAVSALYLRLEPSVRWQGTLPVGGAATHSAGVVGGLLANDVAVRVIASEPLEDIDGAELAIQPPRRVTHVVRALSQADYSQLVLSAARDMHADFVYQRYALGGFAGLELARRLRVPLVLEFNSSGVWVERNWTPGGMRMAGPLSALERRNLLDASLIVVVSEAMKERLTAEGISAARILVNPNGVDVERLAPYRALTARAWRERMRRPQAPTVGFIGTFGPWHGVELLPDLIAATPAARWIVIGAGDPLYARVAGEIDARGLRSRAFLPGLVSHARALALLSACDVCVTPHVPNADGSRFFGSPTKLFEYMGLAKPIVASDLEQIGVVIEHERNGLLHPPGDVAAAAAAIERLLADEELRRRLGDAALEDAQERYSWTAHVRRTLDALGAGVTGADKDATGAGQGATGAGQGATAVDKADLSTV
jgi:glycosyltransferase involved in cell wall biosynthesis